MSFGGRISSLEHMFGAHGFHGEVYFATRDHQQNKMTRHDEGVLRERFHFLFIWKTFLPSSPCFLHVCVLQCKEKQQVFPQ